MVNFTLVGLVLAVMTKNVVGSAGVLTVQGIPVSFESSYFNRFISCLSDGYEYCYAEYDIYQEINNVNNITTSEELSNSTRPYIYNCKTQATTVSSFHQIITCEFVDDIYCLNMDKDCSSFSFGIHPSLISNFASDLLTNCTMLCNNGNGVHAYNEINRLTTITIRTTTPNTINTTATIIASPTSLTTTQSHSTRSSTSQLFNNSSTATFSTTVTDIDREEETNSRTIIISVCVVGAVVLILCSALGFIVWRRCKTSRSEKSDTTESTNNKTNGILSNENRNGEDFNNKKFNETVSLQEYTNAMLIDEYTSIAEKDTNAEKIHNPVSEQSNGNYNNSVINTHVEVNANISMGENKNNETCQDTLDYSNIADTAVNDNHRQLDGYTTIEETGNNSSKTNSREEENGLGYYNNMLDITNSNSINSVDNFTLVRNTPSFNNTEEEMNQNKNISNEYAISEGKPSSEYQRLGQERRDFKNPYQQLLQVEQEQQLVMSDQELSTYTLAKPVLGEATLQIIDVGAWIDNSSDTNRTGEG